VRRREKYDEEGARFGEGEEKVKLFRVFFFVLPPPKYSKLPPYIFELWTYIYR